MSIKPLSILSLNKGVFTASTKVFNAKTDSALTSKKSTEKTADTVPIDLKNKPKGTNTGEYLLRESLNKVSSKYGFNSSDIELEIVTRRQNKTGFSKNHDNYTDEQLAKDIKSGNTKIDFSINQSTIDKMKERKIVLQVVAEKEAFGGNLSEKDISELSELGYNAQDISNLRNVKFMEYGGHKANFEKQVEDNAKQKVYADTKADLKGTPFEENAKLNANGNEEAFNLLMDNETKRRVDDKLRYGQKPALQYLAEQDFEKQRLAEQGKLNGRLKSYSITDYAKTFIKNSVNSFSIGVGNLSKGASVVAVNNTIYFDQNGKEVRPNVNDTLGYKAGNWLQQDLPKVNQDLDKTFIAGTLPKTIGGLLPAVLGAWATKSPQASVAVYSGLSTGGAVYDEAKANGATERQAQKTALLTGGFIGITSTMGYGKTLKALNSGVGAKAWQQIFKEAVKDGGRNAVVGGGQTIGENAIAKTIYDKNRGYLDNIEQRMMAAGITGATLKGGLEIIGKVRAGKNPQTLAETQRIFNVSKENISAKVKDLQIQGNDIKAKLNAKVETSAQKTNRLAKQEAVETINQAKKNEPVITKDLQNVGKGTGGELVGLDKRFKTEDSLTRKFTDRTQPKVLEAQKKGKNVEEIRNKAIQKEVGKNNDALRYTYTFTPEKYAEGFNQTVKALEKQGYKLFQSDNYWSLKGTKDDKGYRGINAAFIAPNGQKFEVQFHTQESFKLKNDNHHLYEETRNPKTSQKRKDEINKISLEASEKLEIPKSIDKIVNVRIQK
jgi:hypothetical protein